ncbi:MAG: leucine-rich repeat protein [Paludibacteraceae bacterium]|nr:leucine-rich repeat protein [Paludibacteraceae bacterium]
MRKIFTLVSAVVLALGVQAAAIDTIQVDGLYYQINAEDSIATLIRYNASSKYEIDNIVIPVDVVKDEVSYPVVALGQGALRNTTASTITFAEGSKVTTLGMQAFQGAVNVQELELPEGIKLIPTTCIHNATATNPMQMKKLVFPASLDFLSVISIALPQLETLEFKGAVPPSIATKVTTTWTQNPWQINVNNACNTAKTAVVIVPAGAVEAYKNTAWIGDYFTTIVAPKDTVLADGLYYEMDNKAQTATLIQAQNAAQKYEQDSIVIPATVSDGAREYPVVALGRKAFYNTTAKSVVFAEGSNVKELGMQSFQGAVELFELELPEGIKLIPTSGIHNASASNPMKMKKLVFPASLDSLCVISIALPQLDTLEFKGAVPPSIATKVTATWTQNPWQISATHANNTAKTATVIVPKGSLEAYQNTAWIGDYFTTIVEKEDPVEEVATIAAFNAVEDGKTVKLTLTDAKVTAYADLQKVYYVEDATAATVISGTTLTVGTALNGTITGTKSTNEVDYMNTPAVAVEPMLTVTDATGFTATETTLTPTTMTITEACAQANYAKLITIENVTISGSGRNKTLTDAEEHTIKARDLFGVLSTEFAWPEKVTKITGICLYYMTGWFIIPTSEDGIVADDSTTGVENVQEDNVQCTKFIKNGQLYIRYNGRTYNVLGF